MADTVKPRRLYDASRRQEQARRNRKAMLDAGRELFLERGYAHTTMKMVATQADVSIQSVYQVFTNKAGLVKALADVAIVGDDDAVPMMERAFVRRNMAETDPRKKLTTYGAHVARVAARANPIHLVVRDAASSDPGAADVWNRLQDERLTGMTYFAQHLGAEGHLRRGVTETEARDVLWTFNSVELWDLLVHQRGWTGSRFGRWIGNQLVAALL